jgi:cytochrome b6
VSNFIDLLHLRQPYEALQSKTVPKHRHSMWYYMGGLALFFFTIQVITGLLLLLYYQPTPEAAHQSVEMIVKRVPFGSVVRSMHSWSANALIAVVFIHMFSTFFLKSYRSSRAIMWITGIVLLLLMLGFGFTGYLLPWDLTAYFATRIGTEVPRAVPLGDIVANLMRGSKEVTGATLTRLFALHVGVLPLVAFAFVTAHATMTALLGSSKPIGVTVTKETSFFGRYIYGEFILWLIGLAALLIVAVLFPWELGPAYDLTKPAEPPPGVHPEWYFMFLYQTLKYIPEWAAVLFYNVVLVFWALVPWLDRRASRGQKSPLFTIIGIIMIAGMVGLTTLAYFSVAQEQAAAKTEMNAADTTHH